MTRREIHLSLLWVCFVVAQPNQRLQPSAADAIMRRRG
jgi:hypothetical protein